MKAHKPVEQMKVRAILFALVDTNGNKTEAAKLVGLSIRSIRNYVLKYDELRKYRVPGNAERIEIKRGNQ